MGAVLPGDSYGIVVATAGSVALGSVLLRSRRPTLGTAGMTAWAILVGGLMLHGGGLAIGEGTADVTPSAVAVVAVVYLGVFAIAYVIYFTLLKRFGPLEINLVSYVVPVFATASGIVLLDETLSLAMVGGFVLITGGFVLITGGFVVLKARTIADELGSRR